MRRIASIARQLTMSTYARERSVAVAAVLKACYAAREVQSQLAEAKTVTKDDKSPVTVADYTAQALISSLLFAHFDYPLVGEEDAQDLRSDAQAELRKAICTRADAALAGSRDDGAEWSKLGSSRSESEWLDAIDRGNATSAAKGRTWCLDPIDGTKGFLRGGQYAVCLALIEDGHPVLGVVGCPNLPVDPSQPDGAKGVIFSAVKGSGAVQRSLTDATESSIRMSALSSLADASFCESVESGHSDQGTNAKIASILGITKPSVRMDSQAKYCSVARADGDIYLRLPVSASYQEKIWDHAAGAVLVAEAGGLVSDCHGQPLDFAQGRTLAKNKGIIAAHADVHARVIDAVKQALSSK